MAESSLKILVAIKRVIDPYVAIRVKDDHSGIDDHNTKMTINPFCAIALEQAVQMKEQGLAQEIIVVSVGDDSCNESLRTALALGGDRAIHINTADFLSDNAASSSVSLFTPLKIANVLAVLAQQQDCDLVLMGKQSIDGDNNQTPQMLAGLLDWPQATFASEIKPDPNRDNPALLVTREVDAGLEILSVDLPCVVSCDLRLNTPRFASLPNIMKAKSKSLTCSSLATFIDDNISLYPNLASLAKPVSQTIIKYSKPQQRSAGVMVESIDELIDKLTQEAKVI